jgi:hypothetical protein
LPSGLGTQAQNDNRDNPSQTALCSLSRPALLSDHFLRALAYLHAYSSGVWMELVLTADHFVKFDNTRDGYYTV